MYSSGRRSQDWFPFADYSDSSLLGESVASSTTKRLYVNVIARLDCSFVRVIRRFCCQSQWHCPSQRQIYKCVWLTIFSLSKTSQYLLNHYPKQFYYFNSPKFEFENLLPTALPSAEVMAQKPTKTDLFSLPVELLTHTLSYLPVSEIQSARLICHRWKGVIDNPSNASLIYKLIVPPQVEHAYNAVINYPTPLTFLGALHEFLAYRGLQSEFDGRCGDSTNFAAQWMVVREGLTEHPTGRPGIGLSRTQFLHQTQLRVLADALVDLTIVTHNLHPCKPARPGYFRNYWERLFVDDLFWHGSAALGWTRQDAEDTYKSVLAGVLLQNVSIREYKDSDQRLDETVRGLVTPLNTTRLGYGGSNSAQVEQCRALCSAERLRSVLGVPLPLLPLGDLFAYRVTGGKAGKILEAAVRGEGGPLQRKHKLLVLEALRLD